MEPALSYNLQPTTYKLIAIVGETASGKSGLAMEIALKCDGEIICADAYTVYPGFDIGTAKPSAADRLRIPHHMLDVADPAEGYSVAAFKSAAEAATAAVQSRGRVPILVGGSGLYIDSVLYNYQFVSNTNRYKSDVFRTMTAAELLTIAKAKGLPTTHIDVNNPRRLIRLLERNGQPSTRSPLRAATCLIGLKNDPKTLTDRIALRVAEMIATGLEGEVLSLSQEYGWGIEAMKAIGYREWQPYFSGDATVEQTREAIAIATRQLAKKQRTWFKRNTDIHWFLDRAEAAAFAVNWLMETSSTGHAASASTAPYDNEGNMPMT